jgi:prevent-host-death family protein
MSDSVTVSDARSQLGALVERAHAAHEPVYLSRRGQRVAAIVDADDFDRMLAALEDLEDVRAAAAARAEMAETGATPIPWDEVKAELGLA